MTGPDIVFEVRVIPSAGREEVTFSGADRLQLRVVEPPEKGKANRAVIKLLARTLGVPRSSISIESGATSRRKRVKVAGGRDAFQAVFGKTSSSG